MKKVLLTDRAIKDLKKIDKKDQKNILAVVSKIQKEIISPLALTGTWKGWYKVRKGDYRILLKKHKDDIIIGFIRHRKDVYSGN